MSLFDETVARAAKAESDLEAATKRIAALEKALANSRAVNAQAIRRGWANNPESRRDLNSLTQAEEDELFAARMAEQVDAAGLKPAADNGVPVRSRFLAPIAALLRGVRA